MKGEKSFNLLKKKISLKGANKPMKNKYKNNADAIKYLSALRDKEVEKPIEEMDCELIASTVELLLKLQGKKVSLAEKEIEEKVRKISFTESSDNVKEFKVNKNVRTKTTQKRILLIAAVIAILVAILSFVSVAFEWDIHDIMKEKFGSVHSVPVGEEQIENGVTFINNGKNKIYSSLDELAQKENLNILLPKDLPDEIKTDKVFVTDGKTLDFTFTNEALLFSIVLNCNLPKEATEIYDKKITVNSTDYYISTLSDVGTNLVQFSHNGNYYKITCNDMEILLDIIENLEEQE